MNWRGLVFNELDSGQVIMHNCRHRLTASVTYVTIRSRTRQPMTSKLALLAIGQFVKNYTVSVQFSLVTSLCTQFCVQVWNVSTLHWRPVFAVLGCLIWAPINSGTSILPPGDRWPNYAVWTWVATCSVACQRTLHNIFLPCSGWICPQTPYHTSTQRHWAEWRDYDSLTSRTTASRWCSDRFQMFCACFFVKVYDKHV